MGFDLDEQIASSITEKLEQISQMLNNFESRQAYILDLIEHNEKGHPLCLNYAITLYGNEGMY
jgi:hypothetical protein